MKDFRRKIAVITGGGSGMGRELARQLAEEGCDVAMNDLSASGLQESRSLCEKVAPQGTRILTFLCDVSAESQVEAFRDDLQTRWGVDHIHLLFNNAGIGGGGSFVKDERAAWERTFDICWKGVYNHCRVFLPLLKTAPEGHLINTSSVNGFWASIGAETPHTAYSAAKFAVKGFTEALLTDLRLNAPHVKASVVMPGHIGTSIVINSRKLLRNSDSDEMSDEEIADMQASMPEGDPLKSLSHDDLRRLVLEQGRQFRDQAPTSAAEAARVILDGVREERWRILIGEDAKVLDELVREAPEAAYETGILDRMRQLGHFGSLIPDGERMLLPGSTTE